MITYSQSLPTTYSKDGLLGTHNHHSTPKSPTTIPYHSPVSPTITTIAYHSPLNLALARNPSTRQRWHRHVPHSDGRATLCSPVLTSSGRVGDTQLLAAVYLMVERWFDGGIMVVN